ncbi:Uncharacterised protein [Providencia rustigianii]|uniref:Lipoprotein n=1 Tax=Providencia rustigianii TaxID=158850 RepID=A0A379G565_9GAMM|nr:hypothetical protein [Providencia rustigianii]SUC36189.1 Uncharacterised protein [Providencia rustigianii]
MKKTLLAVVIGVFIVVGCGQKELSPLEIEQVSNLKSELAATEQSLLSAKLDQDKYAGGLIKALIQTRAEVLETNKALLQQRINAIESGAKIDIVIQGVQENPELAKQLELEIAKAEEEIKAEKKEAEQYSGGLILSMKLATIATQEQTLAMLQQKYLSAKYGLMIQSNTGEADLSKESKQESKEIGAKSNNGEQNTAMLPPESGPFGFKMGLTKQNIEDMTGADVKLVREEENLYIVTKSPKRNSSFDSFGLVISPTVGLCQIRAIGKNIKNNSHGYPIRDEFNSLVKSLESIYGKPKQTDILISGSIWTEPQDWMTAVYKEERFLTANWNNQTEPMKDNDISDIGVEVRADSRSNGFLFLQYTFSNEKECLSEAEAAKKSSL